VKSLKISKIKSNRVEISFGKIIGGDKMRKESNSHFYKCGKSCM